MKNIDDHFISKVMISIITIGVFISGYFFIKKFFPSKHIIIKIEGAKHISKKDLESLVLYVIKTKGSAITKRDIQEAILVEPRVKGIKKIDIISNKKFYIEIEEYDTGYLLHDLTTGKFIEKSFNDVILQEKIIEANSSMTPDLPIIIENGKNKHITKEMILKLYTETIIQFPFIWQRISEIDLQDGDIIIYTAHVRSSIRTKEIFDIKLLKKLWAVFYHLEIKYKNIWTNVYIYPKHISLRGVI